MEAITEYIPRRTYIEGTFKGQFTGKLDFFSSNLAHDLYYDIEIDHGIRHVRGDDVRRGRISSKVVKPTMKM